MKHIKSHFKFSNGQRNGIFLLLVLILIFQGISIYIESPPQPPQYNKLEVETFQKEIDSLKELALKKSEPKIFPFNPNFITDYRGYVLGMSTAEIDRLHDFRESGNWINSVNQFQQVTKVSDSLLDRISPYFKFPDWISKRSNNLKVYDNRNLELTYDQKEDLNTASASQLQIVNGIGKVLSNRIVQFRNKFKGGFISDVQLQDVYGLSPEVLEKLLERFTVKTPRQIVKFNLNSITIEQLVTIQHIDYELAHEIIEQRTLRDGFQSLKELTKVKGYPVDKSEIIELYLQLD